jgi:hypothetical protein
MGKEPRVRGRREGQLLAEGSEGIPQAALVVERGLRACLALLGREGRRHTSRRVAHRSQLGGRASEASPTAQSLGHWRRSQVKGFRKVLVAWGAD